MATIRVHTAQNVTLEYEVASVGERVVANILDNVVCIAWVIAWVLLFEKMGLEDDVRNVLLFLVVGVPYVFYNLGSELFFNGQSIGKKARHIKVMRLDGTAPQLGDYLLRWLLRAVDTGLPLVGGLVAIITIVANGRGQRLGDLAAGTTVVSVRPQHATPLAPTLGELADYQVTFQQVSRLADHDVALVRQLLSQARARRNHELLNELANKVKALTGIQTDLRDGPFLETVLRDHAYLAATG